MFNRKIDFKHFDADKIATLEELKKAYKELIKKFHPDINKSKGIDTTVEMQEVNNEYTALEIVIKKGFTGAKQKQAENIDDDFREVLNKIINLNVDIEICGWWMWVSGNTYAVKDELYNAGFKWAKKKKAWYWHPEGAEAKSRKHYTLDEVRTMHGSQKIKDADNLDEIKAAQ